MANQMRAILALALLSVLIVSGCTNAPNPADQIIDNANEDAKEAIGDAMGGIAEDVGDDLSQELVNFRCTLADHRTIYFLQDKASVKSEAGESWLNDEGFFAKFSIGGKDYLVKYEAEESEMTFEDMYVAYETSKTTEGFDCEINVVTEADVTPPDLEIITPDELADKMLAEMMAGQ